MRFEVKEKIISWMNWINLRLNIVKRLASLASDSEGRIDPSYWSVRGSELLQIEHYRKLKTSGNTRSCIGPTHLDIHKFLNAAKMFLIFKHNYATILLDLG